MPVTDVRDVAKLHILAMEREGHGDRFISCSDDGSNIGVDEICHELTATVGKTTGYRPARHKLPDSIALIAGRVVPPIKNALAWIGYRGQMSNQFAQSELNMEFHSWKPALHDHVLSLMQRGKLPLKGMDEATVAA